MDIFLLNLGLVSPYILFSLYCFIVTTREKRFSFKIGLNKPIDYTGALLLMIFPVFVLSLVWIFNLSGNPGMAAFMTVFSIAGLIAPILSLLNGDSLEFPGIRDLAFFFGIMNDENQEKFESVFELSPYENGSKESFHRFKKDANLVQLAIVANLYQELKTLTDIEKALPPRHRIQDINEKQKLDELQKQIAKTKQVLKENAFIVKESVQGTANCTYTVQQLEAFKKLEALPLKSSSPKLYTDPTLEELQQIISTPNVSTTLMNEAKELEKEVRKKLEEKKELLSQDESVESRLKAIKMFHNLS